MPAVNPLAHPSPYSLLLTTPKAGKDTPVAIVASSTVQVDRRTSKTFAAPNTEANLRLTQGQRTGFK